MAPDLPLVGNPTRGPGRRALWCSHYSACLGHAVRERWKDWHCLGCSESENAQGQETTLSACGSMPEINRGEKPVEPEKPKPRPKARAGRKGAPRTRLILQLNDHPALMAFLLKDAQECSDTVERHAIWILETYRKAIRGERVEPRRKER